MRTFTPTIAGLLLAMAGWALPSASTMAAGTDRELVALPAMMQEHMLANMRDHLAALDEIFASLAAGNADKAAVIAENRLGMSSLSLHGAQQLASMMPQAMGQMGSEMHHAASRFAITVRDAELDPGEASQRAVFEALQQITGACNACHTAYRIR